MKTHQAVFTSLTLALSTGAANVLQNSDLPAQSADGLFTVRNVEMAAPRIGFDFTTIPDLLPLEPSLLVVSAQRVRQHLTHILNDNSPWQGRILFNLYPARDIEASPEMVAVWDGNGWQFEVNIPDHMRRDQFVRTLVEVDLMEMANRNSSGRAVDVPVWLTEGLTGQLMSSRAIEILLPPPKLEVRGMYVTPWVVESLTYQPLALAHAQLMTNSPLRIEQLSWPAPETLRGRSGQTFRNCSQLLVTQLLRLPNGAGLMNTFIRNLGLHYNWQVAFLSSYQNEFPSLLDFEKWWALEVTYFTGRELGATYSYTDSVQQLRQTIHFPVEVRLATNDLPLRSEARLQTIILEWDAEQQRRAIEQTLGELALLRARIAPELIGLLDDYRGTLQAYLKNRNRSGLYLPKGINQQVALKAVVRRTVRTLDELDSELASLLPEGEQQGNLAGFVR